MTDIDKNQYKEIFENIKNEILSSQYKAMQAVLCIGILEK